MQRLLSSYRPQRTAGAAALQSLARRRPRSRSHALYAHAAWLRLDLPVTLSTTGGSRPADALRGGRPRPTPDPSCTHRWSEGRGMRRFVGPNLHHRLAAVEPMSPSSSTGRTQGLSGSPRTGWLPCSAGRQAAPPLWLGLAGAASPDARFQGG